MKAVLNIVAAVLIAAGLVVAVASLLTPGQVILGIDFKLAATLVVGGLILLALARALALLERMSNDLRQLRKAGSEAPSWLRQAAGQSGIQAAAAMAMAEVAAPAEAARQGPGSEPAQEVGQDIGGDIGEQPGAGAEAEWPQPNETDWPEVSEVQWPEAPEAERETPGAEAPATAEAETPEPAPEEETELPFLGGPAPAEQAELEQERGLEPEPETELVPRPEPDAEEPSEPQPAEPGEAAIGDDAETPRRLRPSQYAPWSPEEPADAAEETPQAREQSPQEQSPQEQPSEEPFSLYVVEERMFRGKQARVLSDGTVEAETGEGWMRFEDFDHLEEYLDAMADHGR